MNMFLSHLDLMPMFYGVIMFLGLALTWWKLIHGKIVSTGIDMFIFWLVFSLHGGTMAGGFAAMIAAALSGLIFPWMLRRRFGL